MSDETTETFKKRINNAINTIGNIFGYEAKLKGGNTVIIRSLYAFDEDDVFILIISEEGIRLERNAYLKKFEKEKKLYLDHGKSIGAFLSAVTLSLFEQNTFQ
ncbi:hypothetical protein NEPAR06_1675 [Nematocida parisii]|uniref:Uncharacterized protein n=1 Tax=Nematocida parisii (strain ERTm3) TaxID=935791 RepID=I3EKI4_NEMP3|nr:uncharacterized protein NEPG_00732 [Nematocida parisii ERTm1]EIJ89731.1 hypothetical protein NEQG_00501 [Nematocida parisii ERTm3]KAI5129722.1 hypothetical protein NEPAR08_1704 [Nematocida parisii]KAI5166798.1 hypothetical protein NEIRO02_1428 [Nematocida sp. AWRm79]KAI5183793.1 hypothetical protein NEIRO03_1365 [Nematocida sp. AWRm78]OAG33729.1 hypothetical protein NEIG_02197 [Nematocida sp. ERTm5]|eukprot:XP_013058562.1 hypothetical protein NEPG_00732 [Nematocida parisii ERTm1]